MGHSYNTSFPLDGETLPGIDDFQALVILDGPQPLSGARAPNHSHCACSAS